MQCPQMGSVLPPYLWAFHILCPSASQALSYPHSLCVTPQLSEPKSEVTSPGSPPLLPAPRFGRVPHRTRQLLNSTHFGDGDLAQGMAWRESPTD